MFPTWLTTLISTTLLTVKTIPSLSLFLRALQSEMESLTGSLILLLLSSIWATGTLFMTPHFTTRFKPLNVISLDLTELTSLLSAEVT